MSSQFILFHQIPHDVVSKNESDVDSFNKISFLNKNLFSDLFHLFYNGNKRGYMLYHDFKSEKKF